MLALTAICRRRRRHACSARLPSGNVWVLIAICITAAIADRASVRVSDALELSISPVLTLFAAVLFGPLAGGCVGAASELGDAELFNRHERGRSPHLKWLTYTSTRFMTGAVMGLTAEAVRGRVDGSAGLVVATLAASAVGELLEITFAIHHAPRYEASQPRFCEDDRPADGDRDLFLRAGRCSTRARIPRAVALVCVPLPRARTRLRSGCSACIRHSEHSPRSLKARTSRSRSRWSRLSRRATRIRRVTLEPSRSTLETLQSAWASSRRLRARISLRTRP